MAVRKHMYPSRNEAQPAKGHTHLISPTVTAHGPPNPCAHASLSSDVHLLDPNPGHSPGTRHREATALYLHDRDP
jgi:hypothetical protein